MKHENMLLMKLARCWITAGSLVFFAQPVCVNAVQAQALTLPTVRTFGPGPEEQILQRLVTELKDLYGKERNDSDAAKKERATRVVRRLNVMVLAPVTDDMFDQYFLAGNEQDALIALAGSDNLPDDPSPRLRLSALEEIANDQYACALMTSKYAPAAEAQFEKSREQVQKRASVQLMALTDPAKIDEALRRIACAYSEIRERTPAQAFSALVKEEVGARNEDRAAKLDSVARAATAVVIIRKISTRTWRPVTSGAQAEAFWRQRGWAPLNVGSISGTSKSGVMFTELASPLLHSVRVSVNAVLVAEKPAETPAVPSGTPAVAAQNPPDANIQRLLTGGGLFNVSFAWPLMYQGWSRNSMDVMLLVAPRFGVTAPVLAATGADSTTINADVGIELHGKVLDIGQGVGVVTQLRWAWAGGSSDFAQSVGATGNSVTYLTSTFGFLFGKQYLITASRAIGGASVIRKAPWQIGLTVVKLGS